MNSDFFCYKDKILSGGYYWSSHVIDLEEKGIKPHPNEVPRNFLEKIMSIVKDNVNFYVLDIAEMQTGEWILVEINDGSQSGLSENNPEIMYKNLSVFLK